MFDRSLIRFCDLKLSYFTLKFIAIMKSPIFIASTSWRKFLFQGFASVMYWGNQVLIDDIERTYLAGAVPVKIPVFPDKFKHLMIYYPSYAFLFFWRIKRAITVEALFYERLWMQNIWKYQDSRRLVCFHPFGTVINAKSIGKNFEFRNGLTIGNKTTTILYCQWLATMLPWVPIRLSSGILP